MLNHIMIGSNNIQKTKDFYNAVLGVLGAGAPMEHKNDTGHTRLFYMHDGSTFSVSEPINGEPVSIANGSTIGFACNSPEQVKELHDVAVANGGTSVEDPPGPRESTMREHNGCDVSVLFSGSRRPQDLWHPSARLSLTSPSKLTDYTSLRGQFRWVSDSKENREHCES